MSTSNEDGSHDCAPVMWAYGIPCPAMVSPNASQYKEDKLLHPDDHLIWCSKVDSGPCPFKLLHNYLCHRGAYDTYNENFFVFKDKSPVKAEPTRKLLKKIIKTLGLNNTLYDMHSLRIGRASDLIKYNYSIDEVRRLGRWKSNVVYKYIYN